MQTITSTITNGVNTDALMQTIQAVKAQPELAKFNFRISNRWLGGSHNRSTVSSFTGTMKEIDHLQKFEMDAGEHPVLLGNDEGANPVEYLLHALAACVTTSTVYHAAGQGIDIESVESTVEGDLDLRGFLGLDPSVRTGYQAIRIDDAHQDQRRRPPVGEARQTRARPSRRSSTRSPTACPSNSLPSALNPILPRDPLAKLLWDGTQTWLQTSGST